MFKDVLIISIILSGKDTENKHYNPIFSFKLMSINGI